MILCIGVPKTGTMTMHRAFSDAGFQSCHGRLGANQPHSADALLRAFLEGKNPLAYISREVEVISDPYRTGEQAIWPCISPVFLKAVRDWNPEAWIVLNKRIPKHWLRSVERWKNLHARMIEADLPFLPVGAGEDGRELSDWLERHYRMVESMFFDDKRFLSIDIESDNRELLADAFGRRFPWWGVENAA